MSAKQPESGGNPKLEAAIHKDPDNLEAWAVYGDWLQAQGDPRGEAVAVGVAQARGDVNSKLTLRWIELLEKYQESWLGPELYKNLVSNNRRISGVILEWKYGFIRSADMASQFGFRDLPIEELLTELFEGVSGQFLQSLTIGRVVNGDHIDSLRLIVRYGERLSMRVFKLGEPDGFDSIGDVSSVLSVFPGLEILEAEGERIEIQNCRHLNLKELVLKGNGMVFISFRRPNFPRLEKVYVCFGGGDMDPDDCKRFFNVTQFPALKHLVLQTANRMDDMLEEIVAALRKQPTAGPLETLELSNGTVTDRGAKSLLDAAEALTQLKGINLENNYINPEMIERLNSRFGKRITLGTQNTYEGEGQVYLSAGE